MLPQTKFFMGKINDDNFIPNCLYVDTLSLRRNKTHFDIFIKDYYVKNLSMDY